MADISQYLEAIKSAVYGRDVRNAIHDGIEAVNNSIEDFIASEVDDTLTSDTLPAQAAETGVRIRALNEELRNRNTYSTSDNFEYVSINWRRGELSNSGVPTASTDAFKYRRLYSDMMETSTLEGLEIHKIIDGADTIGIDVVIHSFDHNQVWKQKNTYDSEYLDNTDYICLPGKYPYIRLALIPKPDDSDYTGFKDLSVIASHVRGLRQRHYDPTNALQYDGSITVPVLFGRGNVYKAAGIEYLYEDNNGSYKTKNRVKTPPIRTKDVDYIVIDTESGFTPVWQIQYFNGRSEAVCSLQYELERTIIPVLHDGDNEYPYFRLKIQGGRDASGATVSPVECMRYIRLVKEVDGPSDNARKISEKLALAENSVPYYIPHFRYRRRNTTTANLYKYGDYLDYGHGLASEDLIPVSKISCILNPSRYGIRAYKFNGNEEYLSNTGSIFDERIPASLFSDAVYIKLGLALPDGVVDSDSNAMMTKDMAYSNVVIVRKLTMGSDDETSTDILDLNSETEMMPKIRQLAGSHSGSKDNGPNDRLVVKLLHFSDLHTKQVNLDRIVRFHTKYADYIDDVIHTGDVVSSDSYDNILATTPGAESYLNIIGNHDTYNGTSTYAGWHAKTEQESYEKYILPFAQNPDENLHIISGKCYYYKDYKRSISGTEKVILRLIALDHMHAVDADTSPDTATQLPWLENLLTTTLNDQLSQNRTISVVFASHTRMVIGDDMTYLDSGFDNPTAARYKTEANYPYFIHPTYLPVIDEFVNGGGVVACWLCGHNHADMLGTYNGILNIAVTTAGDTARHRTRDVRVAGTRSQDAFNVMGIDTDKGYVKVVRVGMNVNTVMRKVETFCWDYLNHKLVSTT